MTGISLRIFAILCQAQSNAAQLVASEAVSKAPISQMGFFLELSHTNVIFVTAAAAATKAKQAKNERKFQGPSRPCPLLSSQVSGC